ncbi:hypothetical protein ACJRO7_036033 [Eucalyptus globulus]|uniref:TIR domain-containing protein n=1 Tax=Eucalyptus globulus TaxID=34317 RepID=A0ABD3JC59_EUCGL
MSSSYSRQWTPDVLVSFQDDDNVVDGFTSTLFAQLKQAGIGYFIHKEGDGLCKIHQARFALVVFSANYANSSRRLDDLVKILLRREDSKYPCLVVIPIFHGMDPAEVPELSKKGEFEQALRSVPMKKREEKKKEWRRALAKVEGISGYVLNKNVNGDESELINKIVERLFNEIRSLYSCKVFGPFGGSGEMSWLFSEIKGIYVEYKDFIKSIEFDGKGNTSTDEQRGEKDGYKTYKVALKGKEAITSFSGSFKKANNGRIRINSLTFKTNERTLKPIDEKEEGKRQDKKEEAGEEKKQKKKERGKKNVEAEEEKEEYFTVQLPSDAGKVIEFFGSKKGDDFVTSIGARVELTRVGPESCPVGLFGARRGTKWDDGNQQTTVKGIRVALDSSGNRCIRSIAFQYEKGEGVPRGARGSDAERHEEFKINVPDEYLSSISGYCTYDGITSLTFLTSKKNTKIIGDGKGTHFSSPATGYEIVGFYGWSDEHLHGIGAYYKPIPDLKLVKSFGPFGRAKAWDDGKFTGVKKIYIAFKDDIRYIKIVYEDSDKNDRTVIHGDYTGEFSNKEKEVLLHYPREYLISISGYTQEDGSIRSLIFDSNERRYDPCGTKEGEYFWYPSNETRIIGFYGTWGKTLDSIGVYAEPIPTHAFDRTFKSFEASGGTDWDDEKHSNVIGYRVTDVEDSKKRLKIESITFIYDNNGSLVEGSRHGGGDAGEWVMLDFPKERLTCIIGYSRKEGGQTVIHDLEINTSSTSPASPPRIFAARGENKSEKSKFSIPEKDKDRRIIGFFGKAHTCLNSIGAHFQPYDD